MNIGQLASRHAHLYSITILLLLRAANPHDPPDLCISPTHGQLDDLTRSGRRGRFSRNLAQTLDDSGSGMEDAGGEVPVFTDLVRRSTRFSTSVPAAEVLRHIARIVKENPHPLQYPFRNIRQTVHVQRNTYRLVRRRWRCLGGGVWRAAGTPKTRDRWVGARQLACRESGREKRCRLVVVVVRWC